MKYIEKYQGLYHSSSRKTKSEIIRHISLTLDYHPKHVIRLLNNFKSYSKAYCIKGRGRKNHYSIIKDIIIELWEELGCIGSVRLKEFITENITWITQKYNLNESQINLINNISSSTIDRILKSQRIRRKKYLFSRTRPKSLLRREIPVIIEV